MIEIARHNLVGDWLRARVHLARGGWVCAAYESGLVTHGRQLVEARELELWALPVLDEGSWSLYAAEPQDCDVRFERHQPASAPGFEPYPGCAEGCAAHPRPAAAQVAFRPEPRRAVAVPFTGQIIIDPGFWAQIKTVAGRLAIAAHELGHILGANCQDCADYYAGQYLAAVGICARDAIQTFDREIHSREASPALAAGYFSR